MPKPDKRSSHVARLFMGGTERAIADRSVTARAHVEAMRRAHPAWTNDRLAKHVVDKYVATVTAVGAGAGVTAAIPAAGLVTGLAVTAVDLGVYGFSTARMILTVAAVYDVDLSREDIRRTHVLGILAGDEAAIAAAAELSGKTERLTASSVQLLNNRLARNVTLRFGARMVSARAASLIPLGIGAIMGGGVNFLLGRGVGQRAIASFRQLPSYAISDARTIVTTATVSQTSHLPPPQAHERISS
jgi:hypothetical protein